MPRDQASSQSGRPGCPAAHRPGGRHGKRPQRRRRMHASSPRTAKGMISPPSDTQNGSSRAPASQASITECDRPAHARGARIAESALEDCQVQASHTAPISAILVRTAELPTPAREECDLTGEPGSYRQGKERPFTGHCYVRLACGYVARCRISPCIRRRIALAGSGDRSDPVSDSRAWAIYFDRSRTGHASPAHCEGPGAMLSASCLR